MGLSLSSVTKHLGGGSGIGGAIGASIGSLFGAPGIGYSAGSSIGSMFGPSEERLENRAYNLAKRRAVDIWNMENEYNSPLAQMQRLKEAGLNPMLVYSSGNVTGNSSSGINLDYSSPASKSKPEFNSKVADFFLEKQMESADNQSEEQILKNDYYRLRNQLLAKQIDNYGKPTIANKLRKDKPMTLSEAKVLNKIISDTSEPVNVSGGSLWTAGPKIVENLFYKFFDKLGSSYYKDYNGSYNPHKELF